MHSPLWMLLHRCCQALSTFLTCFVVVARVRPLEIDARRLQNQPQRLQNPPSEAPKSSQDRPGGSRSGPRASQERPRAPKSVPGAPQERPKSAPRASQESPRALQERPRPAQEPLKSAQRRPGEPSGHHSEASELERSGVRNDFRSMFASCAPTQTCRKRVKTYCFPMVFAGFPEVASSSSEFACSSANASKKRRKTSRIDPLRVQNQAKIDQNRAKIVLGAFEKLVRTPERPP